MHEHSIIETGGKQYLVKPGQLIKVEKLAIEVGTVTSFPDKLGGKDVKATVLEQGKRPTIDVLKFRNKTRSIRRHGQRQAYTKLQIGAVA